MYVVNHLFIESSFSNSEYNDLATGEYGDFNKNFNFKSLDDYMTTIDIYKFKVLENPELIKIKKRIKIKITIDFEYMWEPSGLPYIKYDNYDNICFVLKFNKEFYELNRIFRINQFPNMYEYLLPSIIKDLAQLIVSFMGPVYSYLLIASNNNVGKIKMIIPWNTEIHI